MKNVYVWALLVAAVVSAADSVDVRQSARQMRSVACEKRTECDPGLQWSWEHCQCRELKLLLCPDELRCPAHLQWNSQTCSCRPRTQDGIVLSAKSFVTERENPDCGLQKSCGMDQEFDFQACECKAVDGPV